MANDLVGHVARFLEGKGVDQTQAADRAGRLIDETCRIYGSVGLATLISLT